MSILRATIRRIEAGDLEASQETLDRLREALEEHDRRVVSATEAMRGIESYVHQFHMDEKFLSEMKEQNAAFGCGSFTDDPSK